MNNRQKAKHFKQLYEMTLATKPYPVEIVHTPLKHYKASRLIDRRFIYSSITSEIMTRDVTNGLISELKDILKANIIQENDIHTDSIKFTLDVWLRY